jgi:hypothetical protein
MLTAPGFVDGLDALALGGFSALGLRTSRFDFFWLLAMVSPFLKFGAGQSNASNGGRYRRIFGAKFSRYHFVFRQHGPRRPTPFGTDRQFGFPAPGVCGALRDVARIGQGFGQGAGLMQRLLRKAECRCLGHGQAPFMGASGNKDRRK